MTFTVGFAPTALRQHAKLVRRSPEVQSRVELMVSILEQDPYNLSRRFDIKKLTDTGQGKWRIRIGNYRIRYDIFGRRILIVDVFHRSKGYLSS